MKEIKLESGAEFRVSLAPFSEAKDLYQAILKCMTGMKINDQDEIDVNFFKDIFCILLSSKEVEEKIWQCLGRAVYNGNKITTQTFEDEKARGDYIPICYEVAWMNIEPFTRGLYAKLSLVLEKAKTILK